MPSSKEKKSKNKNDDFELQYKGFTYLIKKRCFYAIISIVKYKSINLR